MKTFTLLKTAFLNAILFCLFNMVSFAQPVFFENFENAVWNGTGYAQRNVTDDLGQWVVSGVGAMDEKDRFNGTRSIRLRGKAGDNHRVEMNFDKPNGIGEVSFDYASYGTHNNGKIFLYYSLDGGTSWIESGSVTAPAWGGEMQHATFTLNMPGNVRVKIARAGNLADYTAVNIDDLTLTDFSCEDCVQIPTFSPAGGYFSNPVSVTISTATAGATIRYTLDGTTPDESSTLYSAPITISEQTTLKAKAWKEDMTTSSVGAANFIFPQQITTLADLRALAPAYTGSNNPGSTVYMFTGDATLTHQQAFQGIKYIQDQTAAIVIYDIDTIIKTTMEIGDKISSIAGKLTNYFGMIRIIPVADCKVTGYGNLVSPTTITASQLNYDESSPIQSKLVTVKNVYYVQTGNFARGGYYNLRENGMVHDSVVYIEKYEADYVGTPIPTAMVNITGVVSFKGVTNVKTRNRLVPLDKASPMLSIAEVNPSVVRLAPNPANSYVNIITGSPMNLEIYTILGNLIHNESLYEGSNIISVSNYPPGVYIMKLTDKSTGQSFVQKLVVQ